MKKIKIRLNKNFYDIKSINKALIDFKEICSGKIISDDIEVEITPKEEIKNIDKEFSNYVLGIMK